LTSQAWMSSPGVNPSTWKHWVSIYKPNITTHDTALMLINGGVTSSGPDTSVDAYAGLLAIGTGSVLINLEDVPNQPTRIAGVPGNLTEDALIAQSWKKQLATGDINWAVNLPMTNSAVKAMDAVQQFLATTAGGNLGINDFVVSGGSKRGWTTWLTAAVDARVSAIMPAVFDGLNMQAAFAHAYDTLGFYPPAIHDYTDAGITSQFGTPQMTALMNVVDPFSYLDRYTMPKLILNSAGDQFFVPDSSQFYFADLPGEKYLRYVPNTDHSLAQNPLVLFELLSFYNAILNETPLPQYTWDIDPHGALTVHSPSSPLTATLWAATNPNARDFRYEQIGAAYQPTTLADLGDGTFVGRPDLPTQGYTAYFIELQFASGNIFTTDVHILSSRGLIVPEPTGLAMALCAAAALALVAWRRRRGR
ncbi:MAG: PhoPQ-activated protein PqaA family protein, partial [Pirellulales bacterium]